MKVWLLLLCLPLLSQCASWRFQAQDCAAHPPPVASALWNEPFNRVQQLRFRGAQQRELLMVVRRDAQGLQMQALSPFGVELFQLHWQGQSLDSQSLPAAIQDIDLRLLIADFQLVHWPLERLQATWQGSAWQLQQDASVRRLSCAGVAVSEVRYPGAEAPLDPIILSNHLAGYTLEILNLDAPSAEAAAPP